MNLDPATADVVLLNKGGRDARLQRLAGGEDVPREFFYGFFDLEKAGIAAAMAATAEPRSGASERLRDGIERIAVRLTGLGARPLSARRLIRGFRNAKVLISHTDGLSLSLGLGLPRTRDRPVLIGGFQGLSDIEERSAPLRRPVIAALIRRALNGLDHVTFFSPADRDVALARYGLDPGKASIFPFGIDTDFWRPLPQVTAEDFAFAIGQDWNRDFPTLIRAPSRYRVRIVTSLELTVPPGQDRVQIVRGDFSGSRLSDEELRRLYNAARVVVVPSKDVRQPTGQSVTMQAMSCGRPVILSRIRGLWNPELLRDGENCLLVPPGDATALARALERVFEDHELAARLGRNARAAALAHFNLASMGRQLTALARRGLALHAARAGKAAQPGRLPGVVA